jgi:hypothetical protein
MPTLAVRCLAFIDRRKEYCSGQRLFHTYFMVRVLIIEDSTLTENCRTAIKTLFFYFNLCLSVKLDNLMFIYIHILIVSPTHFDSLFTLLYNFHLKLSFCKDSRFCRKTSMSGCKKDCP